jgi:pilus assembly protein CpaF
MSPEATTGPARADLVDELHEAAAGDGRQADSDELALAVRRHRPLDSPGEVQEVVHQVLDRLHGLGPIEPLLGDPHTTEVMVNGPGRPVWIERHGELLDSGVVLDHRAVHLLVERIAAPLGIRVDRTRPAVDARLPDGSRVHIILPPLAVDGPCVTIRRFVARAIRLPALCPPGVDQLLARAVRERRNLVAVGGTGAGKTTLLNALAAEVSPAERIVTVEDAAELDLGHPHVVRLEARQPIGAPGSVRDLVRNALRMRPDRIVVGEVRGAEALDLLVAMNTGHEGALSTLHANGAADALARLETMVVLAAPSLPLDAVRHQLAASLDLVVHVARLAGGHRRVVEVRELGLTPGAVARVVADASGVVGELRRPARTVSS